jgi:hypothetical protein
MVKTDSRSFTRLAVILACVLSLIGVLFLQLKHDQDRQAMIDPDQRVLIEVRTDKQRLEQVLVDTRNRVAMSDPALTATLDNMLEFYRKKLAPVVVRFNQNGERIYTAQDLCAAPPCAHFAIADLGGSGGALGLWNPERQDLVIDPNLDIDDPLLPFVVFHELFHALDPVVAERLQKLSDADQHLIVQAETRAFNFGSAILGAATNGVYADLVNHTANEILKAERRQVSVGRAVGFAIPEALGRIFDEQPKLSQSGLNALLFIFMYDVNRVIIVRTNSTDKRAALAQNYAHVSKLNTDPSARALINRSLDWWLQARRR